MVWYHLHEVSRIHKFPETESRIGVSRSWREEELRRYFLMGTEFMSGTMKRFYIDKMVMVTQHCKCIWCYWIIHLQMVKMISVILCIFLPKEKRHFGVKVHGVPSLVWPSGLKGGLKTKGSPVRFPVRTHAWVVGQVPSWGRSRGNHTLMFLSLSPSLPLSKKINKWNLLKSEK